MRMKSLSLCRRALKLRIRVILVGKEIWLDECLRGMGLGMGISLFRVKKEVGSGMRMLWRMARLEMRAEIIVSSPKSNPPRNQTPTNKLLQSQSPRNNKTEKAE